MARQFGDWFFNRDHRPTETGFRKGVNKCPDTRLFSPRKAVRRGGP
jgi:hypothetical protein